MIQFLLILSLTIAILDLYKIRQAKKRNDKEAPGRIARRNRDMQELKKLQNKKY